MSLEKVRCLKGLFPTDEERDNLLARQADKGEFGKAEKFMMACLSVDDINARADCFLFKLKFSRTITQLKARVELVTGVAQAILDTPALCALLQQMLEDKKLKVMWEDDKYKQRVDAGLASGEIPAASFAKLQQLETLPDIACLVRSELQEVLDTLINGCRACQTLLTKTKSKEPTSTTAMSATAMADFEKFIKSSVGEINDATEEFRQAKSWETKLVSEFGVVLEDFSPQEILAAVRQLV
ncbi:Aste57867_16327 [Aphanomyces stellatus]|uniref:Aste57867_16327 protein n=1 Tax=Aphanomyces stellatus TaxID=120398 RepID=A0A485L734_9STRA|nr:hypothetical protein As57867_016270 [Aphanomyces stellatus]VFT93103.1 Aste57867_16327 [Aphanomyces stellatus]